MSSKRFKMLFESVVLDFPACHSLDSNILHAIYLRGMNPRLRAAVVPNIASLTTWIKIADAASQIEDALTSDDLLLEDAFAKHSLDPNTSTPLDLWVGPSPLEIDAFQRCSGPRGSSGCFGSRGSSGPSGSRASHGFSSSAGAPHSQPRRPNNFHRWT
ncbi:hypothetical protein BD560DRAFT_428926 [Blakeslea trispora]|nr:hypothetical protein BD560DRAFT_428926 [Blakeslea trispora]